MKQVGQMSPEDINKLKAPSVQELPQTTLNQGYKLPPTPEAPNKLMSFLSSFQAPTPMGPTAGSQAYNPSITPPKVAEKVAGELGQRGSLYGQVGGSILGGPPGAAIGAGVGSFIEEAGKVTSQPDYDKSRLITDPIISAGTAGLSDLLAGKLFKGVGNLFSKFGKGASRGLEQSAISLPKAAARKEVEMGKDLAVEALERGVVKGSPEILIKKGAGILAKDGDEVRKILSARPDKAINLRSTVEEAIGPMVEDMRMADPKKAQQMKVFAEEIIKENAEKIGLGTGEEVSITTANKMRSSLDNVVAKTFGKDVDEATAMKMLVQRLISDSLRKTIKTSAPEVVPLMDEMNFWYRLGGAMKEQSATRTHAGWVPESLMGATSLGMRTIRSPETLGPIASGAYNLNKFMSSVPKPGVSRYPVELGMNEALKTMLFGSLYNNQK